MKMSKDIQPLNGLVLAGGQSSRMNADKSLLEYYNKPQYERVYELLEPFCERVYISGKEPRLYRYSTITDHPNYASWGPLAGLMTAFDAHPGNWLVMAIDYPLIQNSDIKLLIDQRDDAYDATVYFDFDNQFFEPFIGIYEERMLSYIKAHAFQNNFSAQKLLHQCMVKKVKPRDNELLQSIDTPQAMERMRSKLKMEGLI